MTHQIDQFIAGAWKNDTLAALQDFVRLPCLSPAFDAQWQEHGLLLQAVQRAAQWGTARFPQAVFRVLSEQGKTPALFFDIPATGTYAQCDSSVLFYGHLDKQPANTGWSNGRAAFDPVIQDNRLYGRGCADDGYSFYAALTAIAAIREAGQSHPRCLGLIETCEESGSWDLAYWLESLRAECGCVRLICVLDGGVGDYARLWNTTSFRGLIGCSLRVRVLNNGIHSGMGSGVVPESFMIIRRLLDRLEDSATGEILPAAFQTTIPPHRLSQIQHSAALLPDSYKSSFCWYGGTQPRFDSPCESLIAQTWKAQLAVIGQEGLPCIAGAGNVLRAETTLQLSIRIPPHVDADAAVQSLRTLLTDNVPYGASAELLNINASAGWDAKPEQPWFTDCLEQTSRELFGQSSAFLSEGASIPILNLMENAFPQAQMLITGVLGPHSNAHGPDEMLDLEYVEKLTCALARMITKVPAQEEHACDAI